MKYLTNDLQKDRSMEAGVSAILKRIKEIQQNKGDGQLLPPSGYSHTDRQRHHYKTLQIPTVVNINTQAGLQSYVLLF